MDKYLDIFLSYLIHIIYLLFDTYIEVIIDR
jgi:hypothetical protein